MEKWDIRTPLPQKPLNRSSPKYARAIMPWTPTPTQNVIAIRLPLSPPQVCENAHQSDSASFFGFSPAYTKTPSPIFTVSMSNDFVSRKDEPFGVSKTKFYISTQFSPKRKFWANFRLKKALTMGMLICKLPLIVIVAPWKLYSE